MKRANCWARLQSLVPRHSTALVSALRRIDSINIIRSSPITSSAMQENSRWRLGFVLFDQFELLDVFGPAEAFGIRDLDGAFRLVMVAEKSGPVASAQGPRTVADYGFDDCPHLDMFLVPGGMGTRREVENP